MVPAYLVPSRPERIPNTNDALLIGMKVWRDTEMVGMRLRPTTPASTSHKVTSVPTVMPCGLASESGPV